MSDFNNDFAKRYKAKNAKTRALEKRKGGKKKSRTGKSDGRMFSRPDTPMKRSETLRFLQGGAGEHRDL